VTATTLHAPPWIPLSPPDVGPEERLALLEAFDSGWVAPAGPQIDAFEDELAARVGARRAVAVSSGTAALHLALVALGVTSGDVVLCPTLTFAATANAITYVGAHPVFVDSSPATWTIDPELVAWSARALAREGRAPKAVMTVDLYGQCADYAALAEVCERYGMVLVEDAAEALGSTYAGLQAGTLGVVGVFSFNGNKIITTGGGGMLVTDRPGLADTVRYLATQAREPVLHYEHRTVGYNYRLSSLLAAVGRAQLRRLDAKLAARRRNWDAYREALEPLRGLRLMPTAAYGEPNRWLTCLLVEPETFGATRDDVIAALARARVEGRPTWMPMHLQPVFRDHPVHGGKVSEDLFRRGVCLPSGSALTDEDRRRVIEAVRSVHGSRTAA
jgi:dTDP-4-amino-4,6-dideoxygalactose transaminase